MKVLDFGVMKMAADGGAIPKSSLTRTGSTVGTPYYMSLEQLRNSSALDARADVYSLGVVLYECLSGRKPFQAETIGDLVYALCSGPPTPLSRLRPDLPPEVGEVVMRTLSANRDDRPGSMVELATALLPHASPAFALWVTIDGRKPALGRPPAEAPSSIKSPTTSADGLGRGRRRRRGLRLAKRGAAPFAVCRERARARGRSGLAAGSRRRRAALKRRENEQSTNVDWLAVHGGRGLVVLLELKTAPGSIEREQLDIYEAVRARVLRDGGAFLLDELRTIVRASSQRAKYNALLDECAHHEPALTAARSAVTVCLVPAGTSMPDIGAPTIVRHFRDLPTAIGGELAEAWRSARWTCPRRPAGRAPPGRRRPPPSRATCS